MDVMTDVYCIIPVTDITRSVEWFTAFFGRSAEHVIGGEYLWQIGANGYVVIDDRRAHPGTAEVTIGIEHLDELLARLDGHGIAHQPAETYGSGVKHVTVIDPDGNELSLAQAP